MEKSSSSFVAAAAVSNPFVAVASDEDAEQDTASKVFFIFWVGSDVSRAATSAAATLSDVVATNDDVALVNVVDVMAPAVDVIDTSDVVVFIVVVNNADKSSSQLLSRVLDVDGDEGFD